mmetsp:Transcript_39244/g.117267  ORF Transcript_39244/g.117267 Transcript_39244/m.117267 type:complete len:221 (-) Transcript_39244:147-809(-)
MAAAAGTAVPPRPEHWPPRRLPGERASLPWRRPGHGLRHVGPHARLIRGPAPVLPHRGEAVLPLPGVLRPGAGCRGRAAAGGVASGQSVPCVRQLRGAGVSDGGPPSGGGAAERGLHGQALRLRSPAGRRVCLRGVPVRPGDGIPALPAGHAQRPPLQVAARQRRSEGRRDMACASCGGGTGPADVDVAAEPRTEANDEGVPGASMVGGLAQRAGAGSVR